MPNYNYAICIGGTGARLLECIVRLCECGYISEEELKCIMIDSDIDNGNMFRTNTLITNYTAVQSLLNRKYNTKRELFKTKLTGINAGFSTTPFNETHEDSISIKDIVGDEDQKAIDRMKAIYRKDEYTDNLKKGFFGRPTVGTFIFALNAEPNETERSPVLNTLLNDIVAMAEAPNTGKVRVFIAASVFGGTGASGLPSLAQTIYDKIFEKAKKLATNSADPDNDPLVIQQMKRLEIFGCLMLPYFKYDTPPEGKKTKNNHERFEMNTREALEYYERPEIKNKFYKIYLIGDPGKLIRGECHEEGSYQNNMPHIVELFAAAQAKAFFGGRLDEKNYPSEDRKDYADPLALREESITKVRWGDCITGMKEGLQKYIENFILFNYYYSMKITPYMFDFIDTNGKLFDLSDHKRKPKLKKRLKNGNLIWMLDSLTKSDGSFTGKKWNEKLIECTSFEKLYGYLTESAEWYYSLIYQYNKSTKICSKCPSCDKNDFSVVLSECMPADPVFDSLFGEKGMEKFKVRSRLPEWVKKQKQENKIDIFFDINKDYLKDFDKNTLQNKRVGLLNNLKNMSVSINGNDSNATLGTLVDALIAAIDKKTI